MTLRELLDKVCKSYESDWLKIPCWGAFSGPSYKYRLEAGKDTDRDSGVKVESHRGYAIYKPDVAITLAWGMTHDDKFHESFATSFPHTRASSHFADIFFNNALVYRDIYVVVDGGRCFLPIPKSADGLLVPRSYCCFVRLLDNLCDHVSQFDEYFERAGLKVAEKPWSGIGW